tara:strand:- start:64266 stop:65126 length:861 start_codon:yes stop_codon:yes gene_type:complete
MKEHFFIFLKGMVIGVAELIPGVSGGTIALILGIYERFISSISNININFLRGIFSANRKSVWQESDLNFLLTLVFGMVVTALTLSSVIIFFLKNHPFFLKAFFSGLLLTSLLFKPLKPEVFDKKFFIGFLIACLVISLAWNFTPNKFEQVSYFYIFFGGFIGVCAFILPGTSGSFVLLLLGIYELIILALKDLNVIILSSLFAGCITGLLLFINIVKKAYKDYPSHLLGFFYSLVLLSVPLLWKSGKWKILFPENSTTYFEIILGVIFGIVIIFLLQKLSTTSQDI